MERTSRAASGLASVVFAIVVTACSASGVSSTDGDGGADAAVLAMCPPPTAVLPLSGNDIWPNSAVPRGSCAGTASCRILIDPCCHPVTGADPVDDYTCTCLNSAWHCDVERGTSICADLDAGNFPSCPETGG